MASEEETGAEEDAPTPARGGVVPWVVVGVLSVGVGSAAPILMPKLADNEAEILAETPQYELPEEEETVFIPFGERGGDQSVVVNLNDGRMTRYLRIAVALQVPKSKEEEIVKLLELKKVPLRNWLLSLISDKDLETIRGAAGQNRMRREIRDHFNDVLFPDGLDQIYDVLFEEFNVQ
jgi:flagellar basal body-associated protein FliL